MQSIIVLGALAAAAQAWQVGPPKAPWGPGPVGPPYYPFPSYPWASPSACPAVSTVTVTVGSSQASTLSTVKSGSTVTSTPSITSAPTTSTFSIPTASTAASTAPGLDDPLDSAEHIVYSTLGGYFLQDLVSVYLG